MSISLAETHHPGLVIYRYRHGWILINPEVPSRGKHGGAHSAIIHHKSGGTTVGHFTHGNVGGYGPTHAKFVVDKNLGPSEDYRPHLLKAMKAGSTEPHFGEKDAAEAQLDKQHAENLAKLSAVAEEAHANAQDIYATSHHHAAAAEAFTAYAHEAGAGTVEGKAALLKAEMHKHAQIKKLTVLAGDAHAKALKEDTSTAHQHAIDAYKDVIDASGPETWTANGLHAQNMILKHEKSKLETPGAKHVKTLEYHDAMEASAKAEASNHVQDHINAMKAHVKAANVAYKLGSSAWSKAHTEQADDHMKKANELKAHLDSIGDPFASWSHPSEESKIKEQASTGDITHDAGIVDEYAQQLSESVGDTALEEAAEKNFLTAKKAFAAKHQQIWSSMKFQNGEYDKKPNSPAMDEDKATDMAHMADLVQKMNGPQATIADEKTYALASAAFKNLYGQSYMDAKNEQEKGSGFLDDLESTFTQTLPVKYNTMHNAAIEASVKANKSGLSHHHKDAQILHDAAAAHAAKEGNKTGKDAHTDVAFMHSEMAKGKTMAEAANALVEHNSPPKVTAKDLAGTGTGAQEDKVMASLFKQMQTANDGDDAEAKEFATDEMLKANSHYEINHGHLWNASDSPAMGNGATNSGVTMTGYKANDSAAISNLFDPYASMEEQTPAFKQSLANWKRKYGNDWSSQVAAQSKAPDLGPTMSTPNQTSDFTAAEAAGFTHVPETENINAGWDVPHEFIGDESGIYGYTTNDYISINQQLREHSPTGGSNDYRIAQMDAQFAAMPPLTHGVVTTRRMTGDGPFGSNPPGMKLGDEITDAGYSSTTKNPDYFYGNTVMEVRTPAGMKIMDLNHTVKSSAPSEAEALLPRGTTYQVVSDTLTPQGRKLVVEVVKQHGTGPQ